MIEVVCTIVIYFNQGIKRNVIQAHGIIINDDYDYWKVSFEKEFIKRKLNLDYNRVIKKVNSNSCLYVK